MLDFAGHTVLHLLPLHPNSEPILRLVRAQPRESNVGLHPFSVGMKDFAEWFGLETSRIVIDELL
jgi:hypothetical protein